MSHNLNIAILDMNNGVPNQGLRCIKNHVTEFIQNSGRTDIQFQVFDVRQNNEIPEVKDFQIFISSGGPGSPLPHGDEWESNYYGFLDDVKRHNGEHDEKKYLFLICHSFLMAVNHWNLATVNKRRSYSFGVLPVHKTIDGDHELLFEGLPSPFYVVDSRAYQVVKPDLAAIKLLGAKILNLEKKRPNVPLERAVMAIRFSDQIIGTQYHPEADAEGMREHFKLTEKREQIIKAYGREKYYETLAHLDDDDKIMLTQDIILPKFLRYSSTQVTELSSVLK